MSFKDEVQALFNSYADRYSARDAAGCASFFASDAELYSPYGPPAIGRAAIQAVHEDWVVEGDEEKKILIASAGCSGPLGWCLAHFSEGGAGQGTSLNVLARQPGGNWLITRCSLNDLP